MNQPVPKVTDGDVERIARRDFGPNHAEAALALLAEYGSQNWHREVARVRLAVLKLAQGNLEKLRRNLKTADQDYRDVLSYAEYPSYFDRVAPNERDEAKRAAAIQSDWQQYRQWFERR